MAPFVKTWKLRLCVGVLLNIWGFDNQAKFFFPELSHAHNCCFGGEWSVSSGFRFFNKKSNIVDSSDSVSVIRLKEMLWPFPSGLRIE